MKTTNFLISLFAILAVFISCDKAEDDPAPKIPKIKTVTFYQGDEVARHFSYEYDSLGRCSKTSFGLQPSVVASYETYRYSDNLVIVNRFYNGADTIIADTLHLNKQGLVSRSSLNNETREYDRNGYLVQSKTANNVTTLLLITCQVSNGNLVKLIQTELSADQKITTSTYDHIPNSVNTIGHENKGMAFYGKQDKNLVREVQKDFSQYPSETTSYEYEYDAQNRVTQKTYISPGLHMSETYTYYD